MAVLACCVDECCQHNNAELVHVACVQVSDNWQSQEDEDPTHEINEGQVNDMPMDMSHTDVEKMEKRRSTNGSLERSETAMSPESLSVNLRDYTLLRGTSLPHILHRCGRQFAMASLATSSYSPEEASILYAKSRPVKKLDFFISHSWRDDRFGKILALWIHSNMRFALAASLTVALCCCILARLDILPRVQPAEGIAFFPWALYLGSATFFWSLACSHHLHTYIWQKSYFLDKFCVHQTDPDLKQKGVTSFAAFVASSDRVLMLWSPQYFTRLWCTLELAALVKASDGGVLPLDFLPLQLAKVSFIGWVIVASTLCFVQTNRLLSRPIPDEIFICLLIAVFSFLLATSLRRYGRARKALEKQLRSFAVQEAKCHSAADRRSVEKALLRWFANLEMCNEHIREGVRDKVLLAVGSEVHYPMQMLLPMALINLFSELDYTAGRFYDEDTVYRLATMFGWLACLLFLVPLSHRLCYIVCDQRSTPLREVLLNITLCVIVTTMWVTAFFVNFRLVDRTVLSGWLLPLPVLEWLVFVYLQRDAFGCCNRSRKSLRSSSSLPTSG